MTVDVRVASGSPGDFIFWTTLITFQYPSACLYQIRHTLPGAPPRMVPDVVIITEATGDAFKGALGIYRGQRGRMTIEVDVIGKSCHGSMPGSFECILVPVITSIIIAVYLRLCIRFMISDINHRCHYRNR